MEDNFCLVDVNEALINQLINIISEQTRSTADERHYITIHHLTKKNYNIGYLQYI